MQENIRHWKQVGTGNEQPEALVVFYFPPGNYVWGTGKDITTVCEQYPKVTHYCVIMEAPYSTPSE